MHSGPLLSNDITMFGKLRTSGHEAGGWVIAALALFVLPVQAQWNTQTLTLIQGWNPVRLTVLPTPSDCDSCHSFPFAPSAP